MSESQHGRDGDIVKRFLTDPENEENFRAFYKLCYYHTLTSLSFLRHVGWSLPLDQTDPANALSNLAIDILGSFLGWEKGRPFGVIFDYCSRHGIESFATEDADKLFDQFLILLRGFIKKELHRLVRQEDPQIANLKRRINEVLKSEEFVCEENSNDHLEYVSLSTPSGNLGLDRPLIPYEQLVVIAQDTFSHCGSRVEWCRAILTRVIITAEFQNRVKKHELLAAAIAVSARQVELDGFQPAYMPTPKDILVSEAVARAQEAALKLVEIQVIPSFRDQSVLSSENTLRFMEAARRYLADYGNGAETDAIPEYFREVMPLEEHGRYLKDYKYVFETVLNKAVEEFRERLKNDPTVRAVRGYS